MTSRWGAGLRANRKSVGVLGPTHVCPHGGGGGGGGSGGGGGGGGIFRTRGMRRQL